MSDSNHSDEPSQLALDAIADAEPYPYWLESAEIPESNPTLVRDEHCDLCIVGGGYTGLWTAVIAKERDPSRDVVLIDKGEVGGAASGRNGGFMESSLTHGVGNGMDRHADEIDVLEELGLSNLDEIEAAIERYHMDCEYERNGVIDVAHTNHPPSYLDELREEHDLLRSMGQRVTWLDQDAMRAEVDSPTYTGGLFRSGRAALVDPAKLAWELKRVAEELGVRIYEHTKATDVARDGAGVAVRTPLGTVRCAKVVLGTNADKPLLKRIGQYMIPGVRLLLGDRAAEHGAARSHRLEASPGPVRHHQPVPLLPAHRRQPDPVGRLRRHLLLGIEGRQRTGEPPRDVGEVVGPLLRDVPAARRRAVLPRVGWGDRHEHDGSRCSSARRSRTGWPTPSATPASVWRPHGSRAATMLDLLADRKTKATQTEFVRSKPLPFPPEPFRFAGIQATRWSMDREDKTGRRNAWLRTLDRLGLGFDS